MFGFEWGQVNPITMGCTNDPSIGFGTDFPMLLEFAAVNVRLV